MINKEFQEILDTFANLHELLGGPNERFRIRAYRQAALTTQNLSKDLTEFYDKQKKEFIEEIPGYGDAIKQKAIELIETGKVESLEKLKKEVPGDLLKMLDIKNVGPKKVKKFWKELNITTIPQLEKAIKDGKIENLEGLGKKSAEKILEGIENFEKYSKRTPLGLIYTDLKDIKQYMKDKKEVKDAEIAGSARRMKETIGDIDLLVSGSKKDHPKIMEHFKKNKSINKIEAEGETKITAFLKSGTQIDLRVVKPDEFGAALQYFSGNLAHNVKLRTLSKKLGYKINEYGIYETKTNKKVGGEKEEDIYKTLKLAYIPVELRQGNNEIELASKNKIPNLIKTKDIKGELHCHSTYSDGSHSIKQMAEEAIKMGYEYIAITDHSPALKIANGLTKADLKKKKKEIDELNKKLKIKILFAAEVDIMSDGSLDYDDETLSEFDIVVASIHSRIDHDNTDRIIKAMQNPHVHIIGHISGRLISKREPSPLDYKKIFETAKKTNTILEINSQPLRLDLEGIYAREAKEKYGLKFAINTDAHNTEGLHLIELGIGQARRGWLQKEDVINTYSLEKLMKNIKH